MLIELKNVEKMFTSIEGLKNINLIIDNQSKIGILGSNGTGKTTLIKLIQGLLIPDSGEVIKGSISTKDKKFTLEDVAYVSPDDIFSEKISVKRYINFIKKLNNTYQCKINNIANMFQFDLKQKTQIRKLSKEMKQKLKICLALGFDKNIYFMDEPTAGLDSVMSDVFLEYVKNNLQDKTIIYGTHLIEEITKICNQVLVLKNNSIIEKITLNKEINLIDSYKKE